MGTEPPKETIDKIYYCPKVNVWMAFSAPRIYGPYFIDGNVNGDNFLDMLYRYFYERLSLNEKNRIIFQQDGAPAYYSRRVRDILDKKFQIKWLSKGGPML